MRHSHMLARSPGWLVGIRDGRNSCGVHYWGDKVGIYACTRCTSRCRRLHWAVRRYPLHVSVSISPSECGIAGVTPGSSPLQGRCDGWRPSDAIINLEPSVPPAGKSFCARLPPSNSHQVFSRAPARQPRGLAFAPSVPNCRQR